MIKVAASTLPPKLENLPEYIKELDALGVDYIHCDVMDGKFVSSSTYNSKMVKEIAGLTKIPLDVHLMVQKPRDVKKYIKAGAGIVTIHLEAEDDLEKVIKTLLKIAKLGAIPGISVNPATPLDELWPVLGYAGLVLVMSVVPGKGGQAFMSEALQRVAETKQKLLELGLRDVLIEVDGGINDKNIAQIKKAGADIAVVGNYLFSAQDRKNAIKILRA